MQKVLFVLIVHLTGILSVRYGRKPAAIISSRTDTADTQGLVAFPMRPEEWRPWHQFQQKTSVQQQQQQPISRWPEMSSASHQPQQKHKKHGQYRLPRKRPTLLTKLARLNPFGGGTSTSGGLQMGGLDLVTILNYLLLPLIPLLLSYGKQVTSAAAATAAAAGTGSSGTGGTGTSVDQVFEYDTGETVTSINSYTESLIEDNSSVTFTTEDNSPTNTQTNVETNNGNDVIINP